MVHFKRKVVFSCITVHGATIYKYFQASQYQFYVYLKNLSQKESTSALLSRKKYFLSCLIHSKTQRQK